MIQLRYFQKMVKRFDRFERKEYDYGPIEVLQYKNDGEDWQDVPTEVDEALMRPPA